MTKPTLISCASPAAAGDLERIRASRRADGRGGASRPIKKRWATSRKTGTLRVQYATEVNGLEGTAIYTIDLATGMFIDELSAVSVDWRGRLRWQDALDARHLRRLDHAARRRSHSGCRQRGVSRRDLWWRADRGGAQVSYVGREQADARQLDHLAVTPQGGSRFDAWFDADSHLLVRTAEPQMFFKTQELYDDYRRFGKIMLAGTRSIDFGNGPSNIQKMKVTSATIEPARAPSAYARPTAPVPGGELVDGAVTDTAPFRLLNNHVYVEAMVNGKGPYTFIVDTGGHTLLSPRVVTEVGLESLGKSETSGAGEKTAPSGYARYREIAIGKARLRDQVGFTIQIYEPSIEGIQVDGMIGFEYFSRFAVRLDYGARTMTTTDFAHFDAKGCRHGRCVQVLRSPAASDRLHRRRTGAVRYRLRLAQRDRYHPAVRGAAQAARQIRQGRERNHRLGRRRTVSILRGPPAFIDVARVSRSTRRRRPFRGQGRLVQRRELRRQHRQRLLETLRGHVRLRASAHVSEAPRATAGRRRSLRPLRNVDQREPDAYEVKSIDADGPAAQAGLAEGDLITSLNGQRAVAEHLSDARSMLRALPAGTEVSVTFKRGGAEQRTTLKLSDQI